mmetsp:Transcript_7496/g.8960  ORF Transcript_7496/g.8960 Transcript_7496/m.8960 type:complete len:88 (-) Transcript_7496:529-792(-)
MGTLHARKVIKESLFFLPQESHGFHPSIHPSIHPYIYVCVPPPQKNVERTNTHTCPRTIHCEFPRMAKSFRLFWVASLSPGKSVGSH